MFSLYGDYFQHASPLASVWIFLRLKVIPSPIRRCLEVFFFWWVHPILGNFSLWRCVRLSTTVLFSTMQLCVEVFFDWNLYRSTAIHIYVEASFAWILHNTVLSPHLITYVLRCFSSNDDMDSIPHPLLLCRFYSVFDSGSWPFMDSHFQAVHLHISLMDRRLPVLTSSVVPSTLLTPTPHPHSP